jgi:hypothetical protein
MNPVVENHVGPSGERLPHPSVAGAHTLSVTADGSSRRQPIKRLCGQRPFSDAPVAGARAPWKPCRKDAALVRAEKTPEACLPRGCEGPTLKPY